MCTIKIPNDGVDVVVDNREPPQLVSLLSKHPNLRVTTSTLEVGDIAIDGKIYIERKDCTRSGDGGSSDFEMSVIESDKRLFTQSERLKHLKDVIAIILLEGDVYGNSNRMLIQQVDGALSFLATIQFMSILMSYNLNHTAYIITKLARHIKFGLGYDLGLRSKSKLLSPQSFVLEGIPGVSASLAKVLLGHFKTIRNVANASIEDLAKINGIGPKKAESIFTTLND